MLPSVAIIRLWYPKAPYKIQTKFLYATPPSQQNKTSTSLELGPTMKTHSMRSPGFKIRLSEFFDPIRPGTTDPSSQPRIFSSGNSTAMLNSSNGFLGHAIGARIEELPDPPSSIRPCSGTGDSIAEETGGTFLCSWVGLSGFLTGERQSGQLE